MSESESKTTFTTTIGQAGIYFSTPPTFNVSVPKYSDWQCELFGCGPNGITMRPKEGNEPNRFWRWMQFICFGNKWVKRSQ